MNFSLIPGTAKWKLLLYLVKWFHSFGIASIIFPFFLCIQKCLATTISLNFSAEYPPVWVHLLSYAYIPFVHISARCKSSAESIFSGLSSQCQLLILSILSFSWDVLTVAANFLYPLVTLQYHLLICRLNSLDVVHHHFLRREELCWCVWIS